jgi:hypothetical protein
VKAPKASSPPLLHRPLLLHRPIRTLRTLRTLLGTLRTLLGTLPHTRPRRLLLKFGRDGDCRMVRHWGLGHHRTRYKAHQRQPR